MKPTWTIPKDRVDWIGETHAPSEDQITETILHAPREKKLVELYKAAAKIGRPVVYVRIARQRCYGTLDFEPLYNPPSPWPGLSAGGDLLLRALFYAHADRPSSCYMGHPGNHHIRLTRMPADSARQVARALLIAQHEFPAPARPRDIPMLAAHASRIQAIYNLWCGCSETWKPGWPRGTWLLASWQPCDECRKTPRPAETRRREAHEMFLLPLRRLK